MKRLFYSTVAAGFGWFLLSPIAQAIEFDSGDTIKNTTGLSTESPIQVTLRLLQTFFQIVGLITIVLIIYGGWLVLSAGGFENTAERVTKGKNVIRWAIIGAILILASLGIVIYLDSILT